MFRPADCWEMQSAEGPGVGSPGPTKLPGTKGYAIYHV